jgi:flavin-dependent dehydrogenase
MKTHRVIIVGGGPAGSTCAGRLHRAGVDCLILDQHVFPRSKTCAGWITPRVLEDLNISPEEYPHDLSIYPGLKIYFKGFPIRRPGKQYAVRREEFDAWLLERSGTPVEIHRVRQISRKGNEFVLDGKYRAEILVGAGGTHCPVYHHFFKAEAPRTGQAIAALEEEFKHPWEDGQPRLWFFENGLPGYSWYLPKADNWVNLGVGGNLAVMQERSRDIRMHWGELVEKLIREGWAPRRKYQPEGYVYHLRGKEDHVWRDSVYLVGDAAGLATRDMGEGIGPAVASGLRAADSILTGDPYSLPGLERFSLLPGWLGRLV